jgi:hypothetical protein
VTLPLVATGVTPFHPAQTKLQGWMVGRQKHTAA